MNTSLPIGALGIIIFTVYWSYRGFKDPKFAAKYIFRPTYILRGKEYHRLISSGFLHGNWLHLILNMLSLYFVGLNVELGIGLLAFLIIYLGSIVGGNLLSLYLHQHDDYQSLGASGGVCGVLFATIFLFPGAKMYLFPLPIPVPSWLYAILFILVSFFGMRNQWGRIGHDAHLGGAIIGLLITTILRPSIVLQSPILYLGVLGFSVALFFYLYKNPLYKGTANPFSPAYWRRTWVQTQARRKTMQKELDDETMNRLLAKISHSGMDSLNASEMKQLEAISKRMRESDRLH